MQDCFTKNKYNVNNDNKIKLVWINYKKSTTPTIPQPRKGEKIHYGSQHMRETQFNIKIYSITNSNFFVGKNDLYMLCLVGKNERGGNGMKFELQNA